MQRGVGDMISEPFVTNNFLMINQIFCLTPVQQRGMGDMISEPFVINNFLMINQIYPNILFDICSLDCAAKGVLSSCPESCGRNKCREGWGYDFRTFCYQQLPNDQPNMLFDICSAERDG